MQEEECAPHEDSCFTLWQEISPSSKSANETSSSQVVSVNGNKTTIAPDVATGLKDHVVATQIHIVIVAQGTSILLVSSMRQVLLLCVRHNVHEGNQSTLFSHHLNGDSSSLSKTFTSPTARQAFACC